MILDSLPRPDRLASIEIDPDGVEKGQDSDEGEDARGNERDGCWFRAEVEERSCYCSDVDGEFELGLLALIRRFGGSVLPKPKTSSQQRNTPSAQLSQEHVSSSPLAP
jgi:hypothetical protein